MTYSGRTAVIATKHRKESVIGPILEMETGIRTVTANIDTDVLGTFTGEVPRNSDPVTCAREKCKLALAISGCDIAIASEGSFGPHPTIFFAQGNEEILMLLDKKNDTEIIARVVSAKTNFSARELSCRTDLEEFVSEVDFPSHAIILRKSKDEFDGLVKGITQSDKLLFSFDKILNEYGSVYAETDMRAMHNPTRMNNIADAARLLAQKMNSLCPACRATGFDISEITRGLPCANCNSPTRATLAHVYTCKKCGYLEKRIFPHGKLKEDPMFCDYCNP